MSSSHNLWPLIAWGSTHVASYSEVSLVPTPSAPPGEKRSSERTAKSNFLGLFPKTVEDQWDCEIANYYVALPYNIQIYSSPFEYPCFFLIRFSSICAFFGRVFRKIFWTLLGYTVAKAPALAQEIRLGSPDRFSSWEGGVWGRDYSEVSDSERLKPYREAGARRSVHFNPKCWCCMVAQECGTPTSHPQRDRIYPHYM